jgi:hypothetical protein
MPAGPSYGTPLLGDQIEYLPGGCPVHEDGDAVLGRVSGKLVPPWSVEALGHKDIPEPGLVDLLFGTGVPFTADTLQLCESGIEVVLAMIEVSGLLVNGLVFMRAAADVVRAAVPRGPLVSRVRLVDVESPSRDS